MKKTHEDRSRQVYQVGDRIYSIVDERVVPPEGSQDIPEPMAQAFAAVMDRHLKEPYLVIDTTDDNHNELLARFSSGEEAIQFLVNKEDI